MVVAATWEVEVILVTVEVATIPHRKPEVDIPHTEEGMPRSLRTCFLVVLDTRGRLAVEVHIRIRLVVG